MRNAIVLVLALAPAALAQSWSVTASAPVVGSANTGAFPSGYGSSQTLPVGTVAAGTFLSTSSSSGAASASWSASVAGQVAPLAFTAALATLTSNNGSALFTSASVQARLDLTLRAPQPSGGRLFAQVSSIGLFGGSGTISLDVGADGVVDFASSSFSGSGSADLALQIPAGGAVVRVLYSGSAAAPQGSYAQSSVNLAAQFLPGQPAVTAFDSTGAGQSITIAHPLGDSVSLSLSPFNQANVLVFGLQPLVQPITPTVTQLVTVDTVFALSSITLALPPLPPGTALYCQGLVVDPFGVLRSTGSVRALWP
jgi:hypothetical protein